MNQYGEIYLSGSMSHHNALETFQDITEVLTTKYNLKVHNPTNIKYGSTLYAHLPAEGFRNSIASLTKANSCFLFGNWKTARGCITEILVAALTGVKIYELNFSELQKGNLEVKLLPITKDNVNLYVAELLTEQQIHHKKIN